jgi:hypothetical protein
MIHQRIELNIPSAAAARRRRIGRKSFATDAARKQAAEQTAVLIEAVDEAFAALPYPVQDKQQSDDAAGNQAADLKSHTNSLADLLSTQLQDLDRQRGRLARLLAQIDDRA